MNKKFLNVSEVAQRYGLAKVTIFAKAKAGEFPAGIKIGRSRRWSIDESIIVGQIITGEKFP